MRPDTWEMGHGKWDMGLEMNRLQEELRGDGASGTYVTPKMPYMRRTMLLLALTPLPCPPVVKSNADAASTLASIQ